MNDKNEICRDMRICINLFIRLKLMPNHNYILNRYYKSQQNEPSPTYRKPLLNIDFQRLHEAGQPHGDGKKQNIIHPTTGQTLVLKKQVSLRPRPNQGTQDEVILFVLMIAQ